MPKSKPKITINLDLLKPQSNPQKLLIKILHWLLSSGRYIFIFVETIVLIAFFTRFKLDADLAAKKEAIEEQIPYIESLKPDEITIRQTQLQLSTIKAFYSDRPDYPQILKKIADNTPLAVKITILNLERVVGKVTIKITAQAQSNNDVATFISGLRSDSAFSDVNLASAGLEEGLIKFTLDATANIQAGERNL